MMSPASAAEGAGSCQSAFTKLCWKDNHDTHPGKGICTCRLSCITILGILNGLLKSICTISLGIPETGLMVTTIFFFDC